MHAQSSILASWCLQPPAVPLLYSASVDRSYRSSASAASSVLSVLRGAVVQSIFINRDPVNHPFHLHGTNVAVLGSRANEHADPRGLNATQTAALNLANPPRRDVFTVPAAGWTVVRFVADNPGVWLLHCHTEWHAEAGLAVVLQIIEPGAPATFPPESVSLCGSTLPQTSSNPATAASLAPALTPLTIIVGFALCAAIIACLLRVYFHSFVAPSALPMSSLPSVMRAADNMQYAKVALQPQLAQRADTMCVAHAEPPRS